MRPADKQARPEAKERKEALGLKHNLVVERLPDYARGLGSISSTAKVRHEDHHQTWD
jgi:hypothetical protein